MRKTDALLACLMSATLLLVQGGGAAAEDWVDTHAHLIFMAGRSGGPPDVEEFEKAAKELIRQMDETDVRAAVLLPPPSARTRPRGAPVPDFHEMVGEVIRPYAGRLCFVGGGDTLNPMVQTCPADEVTPDMRKVFEREAEAILKAGAKGFGEMTALHLSLSEGHAFEEVSPDHPLFLLLADIAARHDVPIDFHMDAIAEEMDFPERLEKIRELNPPRLRGNLAAFAKLLAHNRKARIVWQHAGSDPIGGMSVERLRELLQAHSNLYVGLRVPFERSRGPRDSNSPVDGEGRVRAEWLTLFEDFPDRFMIGTDIFVVSGKAKGPQPFAAFSMLAKLPAEIATRVGRENARKVYRLP